MNRFGFFEEPETVVNDHLTTLPRNGFKSREQHRLEQVEERRKRLLSWLFSEPKTGPDLPSFVGLLSCRDLDPLGPDTLLDDQGRTAAHYFCDPEVHANLNASQTDRLFSIDLIGDLVYAGISWHKPDNNGKTPWDLAPHWIRRCIQLEVARRNRMLHQINQQGETQ